MGKWAPKGCGKESKKLSSTFCAHPHLSLSLDQMLEWKRLINFGHTDWVNGTRCKYSIKKTIDSGKYVSQFLDYKRLTI